MLVVDRSRPKCLRRAPWLLQVLAHERRAIVWRVLGQRPRPMIEEPTLVHGERASRGPRGYL
eukprot:2038303-Lingulodinium_polyedra.AAC.1